MKTNTLLAALLAGGLLAASQLSLAASLVLYNAQHPQTVKLLTDDFEKMSGIGVKIRSGEGPELSAQLLAEGKASPADVYFASNSPELMLLEGKQMLAKLPAATLSPIPARYSSPQGEWVGVTARENVLVFNNKLTAGMAMPASLMDLAKPQWKGKLAIAPSDGDFLPLVSAVRALKGDQAALAWLKGLRDNAQTFDDNEGVVAAVNRGGVAVGIINNYYWTRLQVELGSKGMHSQLYHFPNADVGALINVSGAGILKSAHNPEAAQKFLAYLVSPRAQQLIAKSNITFEYPLLPGVAPAPQLKPFSQLNPPPLDMQKLGDDSQSAKLLRQAGLL
ncbi:iron ABC transporter substrate-binding protein [Chromobacterium sinusclupearum]|uniref:Iron ABC transporter substrate-binding protein n=1 Tax=Chromobacterium sinusclupearum TaxID=2077146 RepID=A0A2K4MNS6_9NEIS|nr:iron ABC transporter substrate-binding protein [Chromobacterium sinusclupearum]POA98720.1 iron ABC transporter substrate-binding protein [Chromobacterium sinusclupearum]